MICNDKGRGHVIGNFPSWGRRRRDAGDENVSDNEAFVGSKERPAIVAQDGASGEELQSVPEEEVHELFRVYMSRSEMPVDGKESGGRSSDLLENQQQKMTRSLDQQSEDRVCVSQSAYYALISAVTVLVVLILVMAVAGSTFARSPRVKPLFLS